MRLERGKFNDFDKSEEHYANYLTNKKESAAPIR